MLKQYQYDRDKNLTGLFVQSGNAILANNRYLYDGNGNRTHKQQLGGETLYHYDPLNQLQKVQYPGYTEELFYDKAGNRTRRVTPGTEELYQYDPRNRLTAYTKNGATTLFRYDHAGNLLSDDKARYSYDAFNRTTQVETFDGNIQVNRYDAEGLRHEMEENGSLVQFIFNQDREVIAEQNSLGITRYIRSSELIARNTDAARTYYHYVSDEIGSTTHIVDEDSIVLNHYDYDAWGNLTAQKEAVPNRFKFTGQQLDSVTQQYYLRARFYNPVIARFTQEDTYRGDGLNLYAYCLNNPVYYIDPSGFKADCYKEAYHYYRNEGFSRKDARLLAKRHVEAQKELNGVVGKILSASSPDEESKAWTEFHQIIQGTDLTQNQKDLLEQDAKNYLKQAVDDYNHAFDLQTSTGYKKDLNRTFAYGDGAYTVNGFPPDRVSVELQNKIQTQDAQDMVDFVKSTDQNLLRRSGRYYQSPLDNFAGHAEKQSIYYRMANNMDYHTTGITRPMCGNCVSFFDRVSAQGQTTLFTADPENVTMFVPGSAPDNAIHFRITWTSKGKINY